MEVLPRRLRQVVVLSTDACVILSEAAGECAAFGQVWRVGETGRLTPRIDLPDGRNFGCRVHPCEFMADDPLNMSLNLEMLSTLGVGDNGQVDPMPRNIAFFPYQTETRFALMTAGWLTGELQRHQKNITDFYSPAAYTPPKRYTGIGALFGTGDRAFPAKQVAVGLSVLDDHRAAVEAEEGEA